MTVEGQEKHIHTCIESKPSTPPKLSTLSLGMYQNSQMREGEDEGESCPICHTSYLTKAFNDSDSAREAHFTTCFEMQLSSSKIVSAPDSPPPYNKAAILRGNDMSSGSAIQPGKEATSMQGSSSSTGVIMPTSSSVPSETTSRGSRRLSFFGFGGGKSKEQKTEEAVTKADLLMYQRWGPPGSLTLEMVRRYWMATRMQNHWEFLRAHHPRQFKKFLDKGYMEPIPVRTPPHIETLSDGYLGWNHQICLEEKMESLLDKALEISTQHFEKRQN